MELVENNRGIVEVPRAYDAGVHTRKVEHADVLVHAAGGLEHRGALVVLGAADRGGVRRRVRLAGERREVGEDEAAPERAAEEQRRVAHHDSALQHGVKGDPRRARHLDRLRERVDLPVEQHGQLRVLEAVLAELAAPRGALVPLGRDLGERQVDLVVVEEVLRARLEGVALEAVRRVLDRVEHVEAHAADQRHARALALARLRRHVLRLAQVQRRPAHAREVVEVRDDGGGRGVVRLLRREPRELARRLVGERRGAVVEVRKVKVEDVVAREDVGVEGVGDVAERAQEQALVLEAQHVRAGDGLAAAQAQQHRRDRRARPDDPKVQRDLDDGVVRGLREHAAAPRGLEVEREHAQRPDVRVGALEVQRPQRPQVLEEPLVRALAAAVGVVARHPRRAAALQREPLAAREADVDHELLRRLDGRVEGRLGLRALDEHRAPPDEREAHAARPPARVERVPHQRVAQRLEVVRRADLDLQERPRRVVRVAVDALGRHDVDRVDRLRALARFSTTTAACGGGGGGGAPRHHRAQRRGAAPELHVRRDARLEQLPQLRREVRALAHPPVRRAHVEVRLPPVHAQAAAQAVVAAADQQRLRALAVRRRAPHEHVEDHQPLGPVVACGDGGAQTRQRRREGGVLLLLPRRSGRGRRAPRRRRRRVVFLIINAVIIVGHLRHHHHRVVVFVVVVVVVEDEGLLVLLLRHVCCCGCCCWNRRSSREGILRRTP